MEVLINRCAGIDIGKRLVVVAVRTPGPGRQRRQEVPSFGTFPANLEAMAEWLRSEGVTDIAMEATGMFWWPVWSVLEGFFELMLVNAQHIKKVPGRKTDVQDAEWLEQLLECGLLRGSFVPPPVIRDLRDLTRYQLIEDRSREVLRVHKVLESAGIKLSSVTSDTIGVSGRHMLEALISGARDPEALAEMALRSMRRKIPKLRKALASSRFRDHHVVMLRAHLDHIDHLDAAIAALGDEVDRVISPFASQRDRLTTTPGVARRAAEVIIAEIGVDMARSPTPAHLAPWAGLCPGNNESAGKHFAGTTRHGDPWLSGLLTEGAWGTRRMKDCYLAAQFWQIARRRGQKRAPASVAHSILVIAWHILSSETATYQEIGGDHFTKLDNAERRQQQLIRQLERLGLTVTVTPAAA
jgi:transposase